MVCKNCGSEIEEGKKYCGKCGTKIDSKKDRKIKLIKKLVISIIIIIVILIITILGLKIFNIDIDTNIPIIGNLLKNNVSRKEVEEILKKSYNGSYLQNDTTKIGSITDISYQDYDKLITYSSTYKNNEITLNTGGILLYSSSSKNSKVLTVPANLTYILYYLTTQKDMDKEITKVTEILARHIEKNGTTLNEMNEEFFKLGEEIGQVVGIELCRNIVEKGVESLSTSLPENAYFLYKEKEISPRYVGFLTTDNEYVWSVIDEKTAQYLYSYDRNSYNTMIYVYGQPYKSVTKFKVYDFTKDTFPEVGSYSNLENAKKMLNVVENKKE